MRVNFNSRGIRHKSTMNIKASDKYKKPTLYKYIPKKSNFLDKVTENIIPKEELIKYYKFPERLTRRHTIESSRPYKKQRNNHGINRSGTFRSRTKTRNAFTILPTNKDEFQEITAEKIYQNLNEDFTFENNEERVNFLLNLNPFYEKFHSIERHCEAIIKAISPE
jgi:hypothetical protein